MQSRSAVLLRKIGGTFTACFRTGMTLGTSAAIPRASLVSTALAFAVLLAPLMALALVAIILAPKAVALIATAKLVALPFVGETAEVTVSAALIEKREELAAKQGLVKSVLAAAKNGKTYDMGRKSVLEKLAATDEKHAVERFQEVSAELKAIGKEVQRLTVKQIEEDSDDLENLRGEPANNGGGIYTLDRGMTRKSLGQQFISTKSFMEGHRTRQPSTAMIDISLKTLFETDAGFPPESIRTGQVVAAAVRPVQLLNIIPVRPTQYELVKYMEETIPTDQAAETAEGDTYQEEEWEFTERESPVRKITTSVPVTDEQLQDAGEVAAILDNRLRAAIMRRLDGQCFNGNGTPPNLAGILDYTGAAHPNGDIQTLAQNAGGVGDSIFDAVFAAMMKVRTVGRAEPTAIVLNSDDWGLARLARTELGEFLMGPPSQIGATTLFGLPVVLVDSGSAGTGLVGDFATYCYLAERRGIDIQAGYTGTQFTEGKKTLRADMRAALVVLRPAAFCSITSLAAPTP